MADTRCPSCDHVFVVDELAEGWCADCGKKIPEVVLKDARPRRRSPHPVPPPPEPTPAQRAELNRESRTRFIGFLLVLVALAVGCAAGAWIAYWRLNREDAGPVAGWVGAGAVAVFLAGLGMLAAGRDREE